MESLLSEHDGSSAVRSGVQELVNAGWLRIERPKDELGRFGPAEYRLTDPRRSSPQVENTHVDQTHVGKQPLKNTSNKEDHLREEKKNTTSASQPSESDLQSFEEWWKIYPRRVSKAGARKAYLAALKKTTHERLLQAARSFAKAKEAEGTEERYIPHPTTWLNGERWEDERSAGDEFDRLLAKNDVSGIEALVKERYREPIEFVELSPGEREKAREEDFRRWALERRSNAK